MTQAQLNGILYQPVCKCPIYRLLLSTMTAIQQGILVWLLVLPCCCPSTLLIKQAGPLCICLPYLRLTCMTGILTVVAVLK